MGDILNNKCDKCGLSAKDNANIQLHPFPKPGSRNVMRCETWAKFCFPDKPWYSLEFQKKLYAECIQLCDKHFNDCEYVDIKTRKLSKQAIPHLDEEDNCRNHYKKKKIMVDLFEEPKEPKVCRVCLALDVKMYDMKDFELSEMFQKITGIEITATNHSIMEDLCWECAARLKAAVSFRNKALLSDALLLGLVATGKRIHKTDITSIHEKYENIKSDLSIHHVFSIAHTEGNREEEEQTSLSEKIDAEIEQNTLTDGSIKLDDKKKGTSEENIEAEITHNIITDNTTHPEKKSTTPQNIGKQTEQNRIPEKSIAFGDTKEGIKQENIETEIIEYLIKKNTKHPERKSATSQNIGTQTEQNSIPEESIAFEDTKGIKQENIKTETTEYFITETTTDPEKKSATPQNIGIQTEQNRIPDESKEFEDTKEGIKQENIETEITEYFITEITTHPGGESAIPQNIKTEIDQNTIPEESIAVEDTKEGIKQENIETEIIEFTITDTITNLEEEESIPRNIDTEKKHRSLTEELMEFENTKQGIKEEIIETDIENYDEPMIYIPDTTEDMEVDAFNIKEEEIEDTLVDLLEEAEDIRNPTTTSGERGNVLIGYYHTNPKETSVSTNGEERNIVIRPPPKTPIRSSIDYTCTSLLKNSQTPPVKVLLIVPQIINDKKEGKIVNSVLYKKARELISHDHTYMKASPKFIKITPRNKHVNLFNFGGTGRKNWKHNRKFLTALNYKEIVPPKNVA